MEEVGEDGVLQLGRCLCNIPSRQSVGRFDAVDHLLDGHDEEVATAAAGAAGNQAPAEELGEFGPDELGREVGQSLLNFPDRRA